MSSKVKTKTIEGVGLCYRMPATLIEQVISFVGKNIDDDNFYRQTKLNPFIKILLARGIEIENDVQYCYITAKEYKQLNEKYKEAQTRAKMIF